jgi:two-component system sensor histidine kinase KdpD
VGELGEAAVQRNFGGQALVLVTDAHDQLVMPAAPPAGFDASVADWAFRNAQPAGLATTTLAAQPWHYIPLRGADARAGRAGLATRSSRAGC